MHLRVTFVAAARSSSLLAERFEDDRPLDRAGWGEVQRAAGGLVPLAAAQLRYCSPTPRSRATGDALGYAPLARTHAARALESPPGDHVTAVGLTAGAPAHHRAHRVARNHTIWAGE